MCTTVFSLRCLTFTCLNNFLSLRLSGLLPPLWIHCNSADSSQLSAPCRDYNLSKWMVLINMELLPATSLFADKCLESVMKPQVEKFSFSAHALPTELGTCFISHDRKDHVHPVVRWTILFIIKLILYVHWSTSSASKTTGKHHFSFLIMGTNNLIIFELSIYFFLIIFLLGFICLLPYMETKSFFGF